MTSQGSAYARFRRALNTGNLAVIRNAAAELPTMDLDDALAVCAVMARNGDPAFDRAAARWAARYCLERPNAGMAQLRAALGLLDTLATDTERSTAALKALAARS